MSATGALSGTSSAVSLRAVMVVRASAGRSFLPAYFSPRASRMVLQIVSRNSFAVPIASSGRSR